MDQQDVPTTNIIRFLRPNLPLIIFLTSVVTGVVTSVVSATWRISDAGHQLYEIGLTNADQNNQIKSLHADMADVDRRINQQADHVGDLRRVRDNEFAALAQRVAVLEAQLKFLADRTSVPPVGNRK